MHLFAHLTYELKEKEKKRFVLELSAIRMRLAGHYQQRNWISFGNYKIR